MCVAGFPEPSSITEQKALSWTWKALDLASGSVPDQLCSFRQMVSLPHKSVFHLPNLPDQVLHLPVGVKDCPEVTCDCRVGEQTDSGHCGEAGWPGTAHVAGEGSQED